ncbi:MAG: transglycosylase domain-containing protein [Actinobacteria bacterium]|nr:transglycosylase domain-containing protein [Actinomycetota bacterium]
MTDRSPPRRPPRRPRALGEELRHGWDGLSARLAPLTARLQLIIATLRLWLRAERALAPRLGRVAARGAAKAGRRAADRSRAAASRIRQGLRTAAVIAAAWLILAVDRLHRTVRGPAVRRLASGSVLASAIVSLAALVTLAVAYAGAQVPPAAGALPTVVVDAEGRELGSLRAQAHDPVAVDELPAHVVHAVLAAEDRTFRRHRGISIRGSLRALWANLTAGTVEQGGSTITQQYVGLLTGELRPGLSKKVEEALISLKLERQLDKDTILQRYLDTIYWGRGAYGIGAAARTYFGVPATQLDVNQAATLAAMIAQPEQLDPAGAPHTLNVRRVSTLRGMAAKGWLRAAAADDAIAAGVPSAFGGNAVAHDVGPYYLDAVREQLAAELGEDAPFTGYRVEVEMDLDLQRLADQVIADHLDGRADSGALVAIDPRDGGVRAMVGGPDYVRQPLNTAVESRRPAGSAFKPFTLAAFVEAGYAPSSRFRAPREIDVEVPGPDVTVTNYGRAGYGVQTVREATTTSTNTVYMQMVATVGPEAVVDVARRAGIRSELPAVPTITLGVGSISPLELATGYATMAGGGVLTEPRLIRQVVAHDGTVVRRDEPRHTRAMGVRTAQVVTDVLTRVVESGTGKAADLNRPAAGKTGTTDEHRDAWFAGYVPELVTVVWYGNLDNTPMDRMTGGALPAETWAAFMSAALDGQPTDDFPTPELTGLRTIDRVQRETKNAPSRTAGRPRGDG